MKSYINTLFISAIVFLLSACTTNDFKPEYQKDLAYDGFGHPIDTVGMKTYGAAIENDSIIKKEIHDETTKWYALASYHSLTRSTISVNGNQRTTTEQITRDKNALPVARNIIIESEGTTPLITLTRLKLRKDGKEEWLFRHYTEPDKYIEDALTIFFTANERISKKMDANKKELITKEVDLFDEQGRLIAQYPVNMEGQVPYVKTYYIPNKNYIDSIVSVFYENNDSTKSIIKKDVEKYTYEWNEKQLPKKRYTYRNDSLAYITEYTYGYRK